MASTAPRDCIAVGADHGGYALKERIKAWLTDRGHRVVDAGTFDGKAVDYPVIAADVARKVQSGECARGILVDGAGIGSAMVANKLRGVRAALCYDVSSARNSREHNDANVLTLGARLIGEGLAEQIVDVFLGTKCTEERHQKRVAMIDQVTAPGGASCPACAEPVSLDRSKPSAQNPAPSPPADARSAEFQARAAKWLSMESSSSNELAHGDLERVAARLFQLIQAGVARDGLWCFGDVCVDAKLVRPLIELGASRIGTGPASAARVADIPSYIDHTLLKPDATKKQVEELCAEARQYVFKSVCVNPYWVRLCAERLSGSPVLVCTVVGFPLGANATDVKALEARRAIRDGADEIDMVINVGALKSGQDDVVYKDIRAVVEACEDGGALSKVILETALLTDEEKVRACLASKRARADFVKTSTGFGPGGATAADVALMSRVVREAGMGVKASGGVRSLADFETMVRAGATRVGASASVKILKEVTK
jgi:deoxyribose-phosphate aldolase